MFQNDSDEDAAFLDDDSLIAAYLRSSATREPVKEARRLPDWPPLNRREPGITVDADVLVWFQRHHADWRREIRLVLKGWVVAQSRLAVTSSTSSGSSDPPVLDVTLPT